MLDPEGNEFCVLRGPRTGGRRRARTPDDRQGRRCRSRRRARPRRRHRGDRGFTHLICFAAGHEIIRQRRRDLTLARMTPDVIYDQMIGAGVARKLIFSWLGNPGVGSLAVRRRIEVGPRPARDRGVLALRDGVPVRGRRVEPPLLPDPFLLRERHPDVNPNIKPMRSPFEDGTEVYVVPPLRPDVTIVHAQRATATGDTQIWGLLGCPEGGRVRGRTRDRRVRGGRRGGRGPPGPDRTVIPGVVVDAVVEQPFACHPSYAQGYYDRDNAFYLGGSASRRTRGARGLVEGVGLRAREPRRVRRADGRPVGRTEAGERSSGEVNYGDYS